MLARSPVILSGSEGSPQFLIVNLIESTAEILRSAQSL